MTLSQNRVTCEQNVQLCHKVLQQACGKQTLSCRILARWGRVFGAWTENVELARASHFRRGPRTAGYERKVRDVTCTYIKKGRAEGITRVLHVWQRACNMSGDYNDGL